MSYCHVTRGVNHSCMRFSTGVEAGEAPRCFFITCLKGAKTFRPFFMKQFFLLLLLLVGMIGGKVFAQSKQKKTEYLASNGITYHIGDTIKMGHGTDPQGNFMYVQQGGWAKAVFSDPTQGSTQYNLDRSYAGSGAIVKKIRTEKFHKLDRVIFTVGLGSISNCDMYIEDAITSCEIADCKKKGETVAATPAAASAADELAKYKKLLDQGAISKAEYDAVKKKLLNL